MIDDRPSLKMCRLRGGQPALLGGAALVVGLVGADVFVGLSVAGAVTQEMIKPMAPKPIIFALANPNPEIAQSEEFASAAKAAGISYEELLQSIINLGLRQQRVD